MEQSLVGPSSVEWSICEEPDTPDKAPTPNPAIKRPIVICASEKVVPVCIAVPMVKMVDHMRMEPLLPNLSDVKACPKAPTKVLFM